MQPFENIERNVSCKDLLINDINIYPLLRLYSIGNPNKIYQKNKKTGAKSRVIQSFSKDINGIIKKIKPSNYKVAILENNTYQDIDGIYINKFTQSIIESFEQEAISHISFNTASKSKDPFNKHVENISSKLWMLRARAHLKSRLSKYDHSSELTKFLETHLKISKNRLNQTYEQFFTLKEFYKQLLKKVNPTILLLTNFYSLNHQPAIYAANELGIKVIEVQHGVQGDSHYAYSVWHNIRNISEKYFPTTYWTWTKADSTYLNSYLHESKSKAYCFGHPFVHYCSAKTGNANRRDTILITLQPFSDLSVYLELREALAQLSDIKVSIRLHPSTLATESYSDYINFFKEICSERDMLLSSRTPLPMQLVNTCMHVTHSSSVCIEASIYKVPTLLIDKKEHDRYERILNYTELYHAQSSEDISNLLNKTTTKNNSETPLSENTNYFNEGVRYLLDLVNAS